MTHFFLFWTNQKVIHHILSFLDAANLKKARLICKYFNEIASKIVQNKMDFHINEYYFDSLTEFDINGCNYKSVILDNFYFTEFNSPSKYEMLNKFLKNVQIIDFWFSTIDDNLLFKVIYKMKNLKSLAFSETKYNSEKSIDQNEMKICENIPSKIEKLRFNLCDSTDVFLNRLKDLSFFKTIKSSLKTFELDADCYKPFSFTHWSIIFQSNLEEISIRLTCDDSNSIRIFIELLTRETKLEDISNLKVLKLEFSARQEADLGFIDLKRFGNLEVSLKNHAIKFNVRK